jgi:hypothetical protein
MAVQADLALYRWQRLITSYSSRGVFLLLSRAYHYYIIEQRLDIKKLMLDINLIRILNVKLNGTEFAVF